MAISHTIIVGEGFAGLAAAKQLKEAKANVTLISKTNHHLFQPLLYQVATAALQQGHYVGRLIAQELQGKTRPLFSYFDKGSMAVIHWGQAVLSFRNFSLK